MVTGKSTKETVKTIVQGMPVVSGGPVVANACAFSCTRGRGCIEHPAFPAPSSSQEGGSLQNSDVLRRENAKARVCLHSLANNVWLWRDTARRKIA